MFDKIMGFFLGVLILISVVGLLLLTLYFVDSSFLPETKTEAVVLDTKYKAGHFQSVTISNGKSTTVSQIWIPESWSAIVSNGEHGVSCPINEITYNNLSIEESVYALFVSGRITDNTYCNGLTN